MSNTRDTSYPMRGFMVPDERINQANFSESDSSYSESGPLPGIGKVDDSFSGYVIRSSGAVYDDIDVKVTQPGTAKLSGAKVAYKFTSESDYSYRGAVGINTLSGYGTVHYTHTGGANPTVVNATTLRSQQDVLVTFEESGTVYLYRVNSNNKLAQSVTIPWASDRAATAVVELPENGRVLLYGFNASYDGQVDAIFSDDLVTWSDYTKQSFSIPPSSTVKTLNAFSDLDGNVAITITYAFSGSDYIGQYASADSGATFTEVLSTTYTHGDPVFCADKNGRIHMFYDDAGDLKFSRSATFFDPVDDSIYVQTIVTLGTSALAAVVDHENSVTLYVQEVGNAMVRVYQKDQSDTGFQLFNHDALRLDRNLVGSVSDQESLAAAYAAGSVFLFAAPTSPGAGVHGLQFFRFGGWSNAALGTSNNYVTQVDRVERDRAGFAQNHTGLALNGWGWVANDNATVCGFLSAGAGTGNLSTTEFALDITTAASRLQLAYGAPTLDQKVVYFEFKMTSGGSQTIPACGVVVGTGGYGRLHFCADTTGFSLVDVVGAATVGSATIDTTEWVEVMIVAGVDYYATPTIPNEWHCYYRLSGDSVWTGISFTITAGSTTALEFGHPAVGTAVSHWRHIHVGEYQTADPTIPFVTSFTPGTDEKSAGIIGGTVTQNPYPLSDFFDSNADAQFFTAYGGPARKDETHQILIEHQYPRQAFDPLVSPSPARLWRSVDTAEQIFAWDLTDDTDLGSRSVCLYIAGANFITAELEAWDGATWVSIGTWDAEVGSSLRYYLNGDMLGPNVAATNNIGRYLNEGDLDGGTVLLPGGTYRRIKHQRSGAWTQTGGKRAAMRIELQGGEAASGSCALYTSTACLVVHSVTAYYDKFRVRIPTQTTADGYFEAGAIMLGGLYVMGQQWSWGYSREYMPNADISTDRYGTSRAIRRGPVKQTASVSWSDGVCMDLLHMDDPEPDFIAPKSSGEGIANKSDVPLLVAGMLDVIRSGEIPVVMLPRIPDASVSNEVMITDPMLVLYGRIVSSASLENVQGNEAENEVYRVQNLTIEEIV